MELAIKLYQTFLKLNQLWAHFANTKCDCLNHPLKARTSESEFCYLPISFFLSFRTQMLKKVFRIGLRNVE